MNLKTLGILAALGATAALSTQASAATRYVQAASGLPFTTSASPGNLREFSRKGAHPAHLPELGFGEERSNG